MENNKISKIELSDSDKNKINEFINYEREAAIYDLISENYFEVIDVENFSFVKEINKLVRYMEDRLMFPSIFFSYSRKRCEEYAKLIDIDIISHLEVREIRNIMDKYLTGMFKDYQKLGQTQQIYKLLVKVTLNKFYLTHKISVQLFSSII